MTRGSNDAEIYRNVDLQCHEDLLTRGPKDPDIVTRFYLHGDLIALGSTYTEI